jgi:hypothetical protein
MKARILTRMPAGNAAHRKKRRSSMTCSTNRNQRSKLQRVAKKAKSKSKFEQSSETHQLPRIHSRLVAKIQESKEFTRLCRIQLICLAFLPQDIPKEDRDTHHIDKDAQNTAATHEHSVSNDVS